MARASPRSCEGVSETAEGGRERATTDVRRGFKGRPKFVWGTCWTLLGRSWWPPGPRGPPGSTKGKQRNAPGDLTKIFRVSVFELSWGVLGGAWVGLEASCEFLGLRGPSGGILSGLECIMGHVGGILGPCGALLGPPWPSGGKVEGIVGELGRLAGYLGSYRPPFGLFREAFGAVLGRSWKPLGARYGPGGFGVGSKKDPRDGLRIASGSLLP